MVLFGSVLELHFHDGGTWSRSDLRPIDAEFAANAGDTTWTRIRCFLVSIVRVLSNADWFFKLNLS